MEQFNITVSNDDTDYMLVTNIYLLFAIVSFIVSNILLVFIFAYLKSVSLAKECVLLYLYKDVVIIWSSFHCVWLMAIILCYLTKSGLDNDIFISTIISFLLCALCIMLHVVMIVISAINFYTIKTKMLDPPMPWGNDDQSGIKIVRLVSVSLSIGVISIIYGLGCYPKIHYLFVKGYYSESLALPTTTLILPSINTFLVLIYLLITVAAKFYESSDRPLTETTIPRQMTYFLWMVLIFSAYFHLSETFQIFGPINQWRVYEVFVSLMLVVTPAIIILSAAQVKAFLVKNLKNISHEVFLLNIYLAPAFLVLLMTSALYIIYKLLGI